MEIHNDMSVRTLLDEIPLQVKCLPHIVKSEADVTTLLISINNLMVCENFKEAKRLLQE